MTLSEGCIQYDQIPLRHEVTLIRETKKLKEAGVDLELNYKVAFATLQEIRRARGMIMQSVLTDEELQSCRVDERTSRKLTQTEINNLCHLVSLASISCGSLFWTRDLKPENTHLKFHTKILEKMRQLTTEITDPDSYSNWGNVQVMDTFSWFLVPFFENGMPSSDNLGDHFPMGEAHIFLNKISIADLRKRVASDNAIVVLAAAASSGVLEAGIFAHYMNTQLKIPTTVDPIFFNKRSTQVKSFLSPQMNDLEVKVMNKIKPRQNTIVIPLDDRVLGSGYSPQQTKQATLEKYGLRKTVMSPKMEAIE